MAYQCSICDKSYTTSSHLARHVIAHQPDRHFKCQFCLKTYVRQDIARCHAERCSKRLGQPLTRPQGRGQPRTACKRCSVAKISCDREDPCGSCVKAAVQCSYSRLRPELAMPIVNRTKRSTHQTQIFDKTTSTAKGIARVPFLLSYMAAEAGNPKDFARALETPRINSNGAVPQPEIDGGDTPHHYLSMLTPFFATEFYPLGLPQGPSSLFDLFPQNTSSSDGCEDALHRRTADLVAFLGEHMETSPTPSVIASLLTPVNLSLCVEIFFQNACKHVPIVHKSTFELATAELPLLLSVFVVGAVWSYPRDTYFMVLELVELAERCVFEHPLYREMQDCGLKNACPSSSGILPILQAATMLVSISFAFPNADHRQRFRTRRFSDLLSITRLLRVENGGVSSPGGNDSTSFAWSDYIEQECYSRVAYYIYLLDCHISTLYSILPRIPILEMQAYLPSDESAFGADNAETCHNILSSTQSSLRLSLVDVVQNLMAAEPLRPELFHLTAFPLFLAVGALQAMIFTAKSQLLDISQSARFKRALARWREIWDYFQDGPISPKGTGFMVHADEVWLLAQKVLRSDTSKLITRFGMNDMMQVRRWLTELD